MRHLYLLAFDVAVATQAHQRQGSSALPEPTGGLGAWTRRYMDAAEQPLEEYHTLISIEDGTATTDALIASGAPLPSQQSILCVDTG